MDKVTQYDIVKESKLEDFVEKVNARIKQGWILMGPAQAQIQPAPGGGGYMSFLQTLVK
jgi:hypothetical protein